MPRATVYPNSESFVAGAADLILELATRAIAERGRFTLALAGGNTPRPVYARLATEGYAGRVDWSKVEIFFGDERCVPPDDPRSNFQMARTALLERVPLPPGNIHRIKGEEDPAPAAIMYEQELQRTLRTSSVPALDLICLGMGDNGHTASLYPGTAALREPVRWVVPQYVEVISMWRVTFTALLINAARHVAFLLQGAEKAEMLRRVLEGPYEPDVLPAQLIQPANGRLYWLVDAPAAAKVQLR